MVGQLAAVVVDALNKVVKLVEKAGVLAGRGQDFEQAAVLG